MTFHAQTYTCLVNASFLLEKIYYILPNIVKQEKALPKSQFLCFGRNNAICDEIHFNNTALVRTVRTQKEFYTINILLNF